MLGQWIEVIVTVGLCLVAIGASLIVWDLILTAIKALLRR